jgi:hypothetical protein
VTTQDFIAHLRRAPDKQLVFVNLDGDTIHGGYHLTEIKAAKFETVDCGGEKNRWNETIMQLWVPADEPNQDFMTAGKFLAIYERVSRMIDVDPAAEIRFEYGDENSLHPIITSNQLPKRLTPCMSSFGHRKRHAKPVTAAPPARPVAASTRETLSPAAFRLEPVSSPRYSVVK